MSSKTMIRIGTLALAMGLAAGVHAQDAEMKWKWGKDDTIGAANYMTPELVVKAADLIKTGKTYSLGMELNRDFPAWGSRFFDITVIQPRVGGPVGPTKLTSTDDILHTWLGIGSQIDGFGHIGIDHVHYNGHKAQDIVAVDGLKKLGVEGIPPIVTRGVLINMAQHFDTDMMDAGKAFNRAEIEAAAKAQGVEIRQGDVVLFHTGWMSLLGKDNERFSKGEPGLGVDGARYLADLGVVAVGADTWAVEVLPFEEGAGTFEVHQTLLAKNGVYILENMNTHELAADKVNEFMFVLGQPKVKGAVQMMVNPIAIR